MRPCVPAVGFARFTHFTRFAGPDCPRQSDYLNVRQEYDLSKQKNIGFIGPNES
jgi:hypothetical protein